MNILQALENLKDDKLYDFLSKITVVFNLLLDHVFEVVFHILEHDVLDKFLHVIPRVVEVLSDTNCTRILTT